jgi:hypothetical protein
VLTPAVLQSLLWVAGGILIAAILIGVVFALI